MLDPGGGAVVTKILHKDRIEHSDHTCQSIMIPLTIPITPETVKTDYTKVNADDLTEGIKSMKLGPCTEAEELNEQLDRIRKTLPKKKYKDTTRPAMDVLLPIWSIGAGDL